MHSSDTTRFTVRFRGVRGSIPSPGMGTARYGGNTSCVEVRYGKSILILDAGTGVRSLGDDLLKEFGSTPIAANILISHTHWDHIQGFPFFAPLYCPQHRVQVFADYQCAARVEQALRNQMHSSHFPIHLDDMLGLCGVQELTSGTTSLGPFKIRTIATNHPGRCAAFHITAGGLSLVYAPDHEPYDSITLSATPRKTAPTEAEAFSNFIQPVDLLILDTQYTAEEYLHRVGWGHGCLPDSVHLAIRAGVRHLILFHHDPSHDDQQIELMLEQAKRIARDSNLSVDAASENQTFTIKSGTAERRFGWASPVGTLNISETVGQRETVGISPRS